VRDSVLLSLAIVALTTACSVHPAAHAAPAPSSAQHYFFAIESFSENCVSPLGKAVRIE